MEGKYITIPYTSKIRADLEGQEEEESDVTKELFIRYYNVRKRWAPVFKREKYKFIEDIVASFL